MGPELGYMTQGRWDFSPHSHFTPRLAQAAGPDMREEGWSCVDRTGNRGNPDCRLGALSGPNPPPWTQDGQSWKGSEKLHCPLIITAGETEPQRKENHMDNWDPEPQLPKGLLPLIWVANWDKSTASSR